MPGSSPGITPNMRGALRGTKVSCHAPRMRGYPVRRGISINYQRLWNTGSPAFAGDDTCECGYSRASISARRRQRLHDLTERRQRLAARGVRDQRRIAHDVEQSRMRLGGEPKHAGHRDIGVADAHTEPIRRGDSGAFGFQHLEHTADLSLATLDPEF